VQQDSFCACIEEHNRREADTGSLFSLPDDVACLGCAYDVHEAGRHMAQISPGVEHEPAEGAWDDSATYDDISRGEGLAGGDAKWELEQEFVMQGSLDRAAGQPREEEQEALGKEAGALHGTDYDCDGWDLDTKPKAERKGAKPSNEGRPPSKTKRYFACPSVCDRRRRPPPLRRCATFSSSRSLLRRIRCRGSPFCFGFDRVRQSRRRLRDVGTRKGAVCDVAATAAKKEAVVVGPLLLLLLLSSSFASAAAPDSSSIRDRNGRRSRQRRGRRKKRYHEHQYRRRGRLFPERISLSSSSSNQHPWNLFNCVPSSVVAVRG